ncbi:MAG: hypothetical protein ACOYT8_00785 [Candidatus Dependentiae bacterium]
MKKFIITASLGIISFSNYAMEVNEIIPKFYLGIISNNTDQDIALIDSTSNKLIANIDRDSSKRLDLEVRLKEVDHTWFRIYKFQQKKAAISMQIEDETKMMIRQNRKIQLHDTSIFLYYKDKLQNALTIKEWHKHNYQYEGEEYLINVILEGNDLRQSRFVVRQLGNPTVKETEGFER